ncbi:hypothetical protein KC19_VG099600 [Ceratodon purpureus]|uniref:Uncharacterized protein n=1 Tax=Ceratodon purpureus TaxID=3225 RepID=A0A8T0HNJ7_CERPU|nr:hypothetical protein KC19_VG099600 [Ceratodon purpureus]
MLKDPCKRNLIKSRTLRIIQHTGQYMHLYGQIECEPVRSHEFCFPCKLENSVRIHEPCLLLILLSPLTPLS